MRVSVRSVRVEAPSFQNSKAGGWTDPHIEILMKRDVEQTLIQTGLTRHDVRRLPCSADISAQMILCAGGTHFPPTHVDPSSGVTTVNALALLSRPAKVAERNKEFIVTVTLVDTSTLVSYGCHRVLKSVC